MNNRERIIKALKHHETDRIPMAIQFAANKYEEFVERTGETDPYRYFDLDYRHLEVMPPESLPDFSQYFEERVPDWPDMDNEFEIIPFRGSNSYFVMGENNTAMNEWGEYRIYGEDKDYHKKVFPLNKTGCTLADIEAYPFPDLKDQSRYNGLDDRVRKIQQDGYASVLSWEMTIFEKSWRIRGMEQLMMDFVLNPALVECLMDRIAEQTGFLAAQYARAGTDIIQLGDDIGTQKAMMISPDIWRKFIKPRMAEIIANIKSANSETIVFYHSDGIIEPVIPDLIEIGVEVLNPVQPECMDIFKLNKEYGYDLAFWGGIGVQTTMPYGSTDEVRQSVKKLINYVGKDGGLVVSPGHLIERDIPWENVMAFVNAVADYGSY